MCARNYDAHIFKHRQKRIVNMSIFYNIYGSLRTKHLLSIFYCFEETTEETRRPFAFDPLP